MNHQETWWWTIYSTRCWGGEPDDDYTTYKAIEKIVAEASRRAKLEAWEEARDLIHRDLEAAKSLQKWEPRIHDEYISGFFEAYRLLHSRVCALSRSWKE